MNKSHIIWCKIGIVTSCQFRREPTLGLHLFSTTIMSLWEQTCCFTPFSICTMIVQEQTCCFASLTTATMTPWEQTCYFASLATTIMPLWEQTCSITSFSIWIMVLWEQTCCFTSFQHIQPQWFYKIHLLFDIYFNIYLSATRTNLLF